MGASGKLALNDLEMSLNACVTKCIVGLSLSRRVIYWRIGSSRLVSFKILTQNISSLTFLFIGSGN